jgi:hypothetical protein
MTRVSIRAIVIGAACVLLAAPASGQGWSLGGVRLSTDHPTLGEVTGGTIGLRAPRASHVFRLDLGRLQRREERIGSACVGLAFPGECQPEPLTEEVFLWLADAGFGGRLFGDERLSAQFTVDVQLALAQVSAREHESGRHRAASKPLLGGAAGLQLGWRPSRRVPLVIEVGITSGGMVPVLYDGIVDGYTPFEDGFGGRQLRLGLGWRSAFVRR